MGRALRAMHRGEQAAGTGRRRGVAARGELVVGVVVVVVTEIVMWVGRGRGGSRAPIGHLLLPLVAAVWCIMLTPLQGCMMMMAMVLVMMLQWMMMMIGSWGRVGQQGRLRAGQWWAGGQTLIKS